MKKILPILIVALIIGGISFYGGTIFAKQQKPTQPSSRSGGIAGAAGRAFVGQGRDANGGFVNGEVVSKDATSITIKLQTPPGGQANGGTGSKIVFYSASTTVSKMAQGSIDDLTPGTSVMVIGQTGTDGSVTAQSIQIRPLGETLGNRIGAPGQGQPRGGQPSGQ